MLLYQAHFLAHFKLTFWLTLSSLFVRLFTATYPGALSGYKLQIVESHQSGKADTSGTAKAVADSLAKLNASGFGVEDIEMVRDPPAQIAFGVTESAIAGHAYHTYRLTSPDGTVALEMKHNVDGREVYCEGTYSGAQICHADPAICPCVWVYFV